MALLPLVEMGTAQSIVPEYDTCVCGGWPKGCQLYGVFPEEGGLT